MSDEDIVVLVPGIMGSVLQKDGKDAFGLTASAGLRALFTGGRSITDLAVDLHAGPSQRPADGIKAVAVASDAHLIPGLWKIDGYSKLRSYLTKRLRLVPGESYFELPYDWRLDNRIAAYDLRDAVTGWLALRRRSKPYAKTILVAHSMGGLVARYYLEVLGGWRDTRALITFGTPYWGSMDALDFLVNGFRKAFGLVDLTDLVRTFPSVHQLLPTYRCVDLGDGPKAYVSDVAPQIPRLLDPVAVTAARAFHTEMDDAVAANRKLDQYVEQRYRLLTVVGVEHPTKQSAVLVDGGLVVLDTTFGADHGGDGTVPRVSATPIELKTDENAMFAGTRHSSLQNADAVLTHLRGWLSAVDLTNFRAGAPVQLSVQLNDLFSDGEPIRVLVTPSEAIAELRYHLEQVAVADSEDPTVVKAPPVIGSVPALDGVNEVEIPTPGPGAYRLTLGGGAEVEPVSDLVVVAPH